MTGTLENLYFDAAAIAVASQQGDRIKSPEISAERMAPSCLLWLLGFAHLVIACTFALAAACTCRFLFFMRFPVGALLGLLIYGLILMGAWASERLAPGV